MAERFIERSMLCPGRSDCGAHPTVMALVCTTCAIGSRRTPSCNGTGPVRIPSDDCPCCPPTSATCTSPTRSGIWKASPELMREAMRRLEQRWEDRP